MHLMQQETQTKTKARGALGERQAGSGDVPTKAEREAPDRAPSCRKTKREAPDRALSCRKTSARRRVER